MMPINTKDLTHPKLRFKNKRENILTHHASITNEELICLHK
jgi:hypothetical protein